MSDDNSIAKDRPREYRDSEARLAACVEVLNSVLQFADPMSDGDVYTVVHARALLSSADISPWRDLIEAVRAQVRVFEEEDAGPYKCQKAILDTLGAARRCGLVA